MTEADAPKVLTASATVEVPFHDVDAMNVCWHGHYLKYFEIGRAALLRVFDYDYREMQASGYLWPIVEAHLKYVRPATYGQQVEVRAQLLEWTGLRGLDRILVAHGDVITRDPPGVLIRLAESLMD